MVACLAKDVQEQLVIRDVLHVVRGQAVPLAPDTQVPSIGDVGARSERGHLLGSDVDAGSNAGVAEESRDHPANKPTTMTHRTRRD